MRQEPSGGNADTKSAPLNRSGEGSKLGSFKPAIPGADVLDVRDADVLDVSDVRDADVLDVSGRLVKLLRLISAIPFRDELGITHR